MTPLNCMRIVMFSDRGWDDIRHFHPEVMRSFFQIVVPFSFLPPMMLLVAGYFHPGAFLIDAPFARWCQVALAFFITELLTVPVMAWVIKDMAGLHKIESDFRDAFLLAAITAIPLWLSSMALALPNLWSLVIIVATGLLVSAGVLHHGVRALFKINDGEIAQALSSSAFSVGGLVWALLCALVVLPLIE
jgi:hypothetical protein